MRALLLASTALFALGGHALAQGCSVPGPAASAGYTTQTYGGSPTLGKNVVPFAYYGVNAQGATTQNADGSVTIQDQGNNYGAQLSVPGGFGGGGYFQATMAFPTSQGTGGGAFWANTLEGMTGGAGTTMSSWAEIDILEMDSNATAAAGQYQNQYHAWQSLAGAQTVGIPSGNAQVPPGTDFSQPHNYGMLWIPATPSSQGMMKFYFDGRQVNQTITWSYGSALANALDPYHLSLIFGTGGTPTTLSNVQVWQASGAGNVGLPAQAATCGGSATPVVMPSSLYAPGPSNAPVSTTPTTPAAPSTPTDSGWLKPGGRSVKDCNGNEWSLSDYGNGAGSVLKNGQPVPGGGDTTALALQGCSVMGKDSGHGPVNPGGWFNLSSNDQYWLPASGPPSGSPTPPVQTPGPCPTELSGSGGFHVVGGKIIGPNGKPWIARGINVYGPTADASAQAITTTFKGVNFIRYVAQTLNDPSTYDAFVNQMTAQGRVVEIEHHPDGGGAQDAAPPEGIPAESAWYAALGKHFAANPYLWLGTFNEPKTTPQLSGWHRATYDAVRGAGNTSPVMLEVAGSRPNNLQQGLNPSIYATMTNVIWDVHVYGYQNDYSSDETSITNNINGMVAAAQTIKSADGVVPVIIGESGPSTNGSSLDPNGYATVQQLITVATGGTMGGVAHFTWYPGFASPNDLTDASGNVSDPYGQMAQLYINTDVVPPNQCQLNQASQQAINDATKQLSGK